MHAVSLAGSRAVPYVRQAEVDGEFFKNSRCELKDLSSAVGAASIQLVCVRKTKMIESPQMCFNFSINNTHYRFVECSYYGSVPAHFFAGFGTTMEEMLKKPASVTIEGEKTGEKIDAEKTGEKIEGEDAKTVEGEKTGEKIEGEKTGMETPQLADQVGEQQTPSPGWVDQATGIVHRPLNQAAGPGEKIEGEKTGEPSLKRQGREGGGAEAV